MKRMTIGRLYDELAAVLFAGKISFCELMDIYDMIHEFEELYDCSVDYEFAQCALIGKGIPKEAIKDICDILKNAEIIA